MAVRTIGPIKSTALVSARYDDETQQLDVFFVNGSMYTYEGVPPEIVDGLENADSPGSYFHANIRGQYGS